MSPRCPLLIVATAALLAPCVQAIPTSAADLGAPITISDANFQVLPSTATPAQVFSKWYANHEDNETETNPNTLKGQEWDLEGMFLNGTSLTLVGGFDFRNGQSVPSVSNHVYTSGDLFIDVDGDAVFGFAANQGSGVGGTTLNSFGYDYVIHFDPTFTSFNAFAIDGTATLMRTSDIPSSNPWKYVSGGSLLTATSQTLEYGLLAPAVYDNLLTFGSPTIGLKGYNTNDNHYYVTVDVGFVPPTSLATFHFTQECGNDNLMGQSAIPEVPDTASSALLLFIGLVPLLASRRARAAH